MQSSGFKRFDNAAVTISGIELVQKIQKHQSKLDFIHFKAGSLNFASIRWLP